MDYNTLDQSTGLSLRANELWLLYYQQKNYALAMSAQQPNPGFACYALWQSFNDMALYFNYVGMPWAKVSPNGNSFDLWQAMKQLYGGPTKDNPSLPSAFSPISMGNFADNDALSQFCKAVQGTWSCNQGCEGNGFEDIVSSLTALFGTPSNMMPKTVYNCYNDCNNSAAYIAVSTLTESMQTYIGQSKNPNSSLMTQIAAQIVAINEIANLTDGNLTGLQKFINAPELGFNVSPKIKGSSLVYFSSTSTQDLNMLATSLNQTSLDGNGNGFYQLLLNIMAGEYQNALSTPPSSCTSPATGYCNWLNCRTPNMCVDGTCCAKSCVGNTCCSIDINKNPLGLPSPDGICP